jgi:predicted DNA-binding protein
MANTCVSETTLARVGLPTDLYKRLSHHAIDRGVGKAEMIAEAVKIYVEMLDAEDAAAAMSEESFRRGGR